jgi:phosphoribosylamine--glycine ligase
MMLKNGLYQPISAALDGRIDEINIEFNPGSACCVVMASNGYPESYQTGFPIGGLDIVKEWDNLKVFHAGTALDSQGRVMTSGGRVLGVTAYSAKGIADAKKIAYAAVKIIDSETKKLNNNNKIFGYRNDISDKALL